MSKTTRRSFLKTTAAAACGAVLAHQAQAVVKEQFAVGSQSYSFRKFDTAGALEQLNSLGLNQMEFCAVHFAPDPKLAGLEAIKAQIAAAGVTVPCFGVEGFGGDEAANRKKFEFAKAMDIKILTADPSPEAFDNLDKLTEEFGIAIAIHNHGPGARYDKVADTLKAVKGHNPMIGACLDTGHCIRSSEKPHEVIEALGDRLISMHLKDWNLNGEEQTLGEGDLDLAAVVKAMKAVKFDGPLMLEYENFPEDPAPHMKTGIENWRKAVAAG